MRSWQTLRINRDSAWHDGATQTEARAGSHWRLLFARDFGLIWLSQLVSQVGDGISNLALLWFVYSITGSPVKTTIIGLLHTIPPIVLGPFIGVYVDRLPKKFFLIGSNVFRALLIGIIPCAVSTDTFTVNLLYVLVLLDAVAMATFSPALTSSVPLIVPRAQFTAANALIQSTTSLGIIFGPALERDRDCPVRFAGSALSERGHVSCVCALSRVSAPGNSAPICGTNEERVVQCGTIYRRGWPSS